MSELPNRINVPHFGNLGLGQSGRGGGGYSTKTVSFKYIPNFVIFSKGTLWTKRHTPGNESISPPPLKLREFQAATSYSIHLFRDLAALFLSLQQLPARGIKRITRSHGRKSVCKEMYKMYTLIEVLNEHPVCQNRVLWSEGGGEVWGKTALFRSVPVSGNPSHASFSSR